MPPKLDPSAQDDGNNLPITVAVGLKSTGDIIDISGRCLMVNAIIVHVCSDILGIPCDYPVCIVSFVMEMASSLILDI